MKQRKSPIRRLLSLLTAMAMCLSVMGGLALGAAAEEACHTVDGELYLPLNDLTGAAGYSSSRPYENFNDTDSGGTVATNLVMLLRNTGEYVEYSFDLADDVTAASLKLLITNGKVEVKPAGGEFTVLTAKNGTGFNRGAAIYALDETNALSGTENKFTVRINYDGRPGADTILNGLLIQTKLDAVDSAYTMEAIGRSYLRNLHDVSSGAARYFHNSNIPTVFLHNGEHVTLHYKVSGEAEYTTVSFAQAGQPLTCEVSANGSQWTAAASGTQVTHKDFYVRFTAKAGDAFLQNVTIAPKIAAWQQVDGELYLPLKDLTGAAGYSSSKPYENFNDTYYDGEAATNPVMLLRYPGEYVEYNFDLADDVTAASLKLAISNGKVEVKPKGGSYTALTATNGSGFNRGAAIYTLNESNALSGADRKFTVRISYAGNTTILNGLLIQTGEPVLENAHTIGVLDQAYLSALYDQTAGVERYFLNKSVPTLWMNPGEQATFHFTVSREAESASVSFAQVYGYLTCEISADGTAWQTITNGAQVTYKDFYVRFTNRAGTDEFLQSVTVTPKMTTWMPVDGELYLPMNDLTGAAGYGGNPYENFNDTDMGGEEATNLVMLLQNAGEYVEYNFDLADDVTSASLKLLVTRATVQVKPQGGSYTTLTAKNGAGFNRGAAIYALDETNALSGAENKFTVRIDFAGSADAATVLNGLLLQTEVEAIAGAYTMEAIGQSYLRNLWDISAGARRYFLNKSVPTVFIHNGEYATFRYVIDPEGDGAFIHFAQAGDGLTAQYSADGVDWTEFTTGSRVRYNDFYVRFTAEMGDAFLQSVTLEPVMPVYTQVDGDLYLPMNDLSGTSAHNGNIIENYNDTYQGGSVDNKTMLLQPEIDDTAGASAATKRNLKNTQSQAAAAPDRQTPKPAYETSKTINWINMDGFSNNDLMMMTTLQGNVNRDTPSMYIIHDEIIEGSGEINASQFWFDQLDLTYTGADAFTKVQHTDPYRMLVANQNFIKGYVLYHERLADGAMASKVGYTGRYADMAVLNLTLMLCGQYEAVALTEAQYNTLKNQYGLTLTKLGDTTAFMETSRWTGKITDDRDSREVWKNVYTYALDTIGAENFNQNVIAHNAGFQAADFDYFVANKLFVYNRIFTGDGVNDTSATDEEKALEQRILSVTGDNTPVFGCWYLQHDEAGLVDAITARSKYIVVTYETFNLSWTSGLPYEELNVTDEKLTLEPGKKYVAFTFSEGDNNSYLQFRMPTLFEHASKGAYPIGWTIAPTSWETNPNMIRYFRMNWSKKDGLSMPEAGVGYVNATPPASTQDDFFAISDRYLASIGATTIRTLKADTVAAMPYAEHMENLDAMLCGYLDTGNENFNNDLSHFMFRDKVFFTAYDGQLADKLSQSDNGGTAFYMVSLYGWNQDPGSAQAIMEALGDDFVAVTPTQLADLYRQYYGGEFTNVTAASIDKAMTRSELGFLYMASDYNAYDTASGARTGDSFIYKFDLAPNAVQTTIFTDVKGNYTIEVSSDCQTWTRAATGSNGSKATVAFVVNNQQGWESGKPLYVRFSGSNVAMYNLYLKTDVAERTYIDIIGTQDKIYLHGADDGSNGTMGANGRTGTFTYYLPISSTVRSGDLMLAGENVTVQISADNVSFAHVALHKVGSTWYSKLQDLSGPIYLKITAASPLTHLRFSPTPEAVTEFSFSPVSNDTTEKYLLSLDDTTVAETGYDSGRSVSSGNAMIYRFVTDGAVDKAKLKVNASGSYALSVSNDCASFETLAVDELGNADIGSYARNGQTVYVKFEATGGSAKLMNLRLVTDAAVSADDTPYVEYSFDLADHVTEATLKLLITNGKVEVRPAGGEFVGLNAKNGTGFDRGTAIYTLDETNALAGDANRFILRISYAGGPTVLNGMLLQTTGAGMITQSHTTNALGQSYLQNLNDVSSGASRYFPGGTVPAVHLHQGEHITFSYTVPADAGNAKVSFTAVGLPLTAEVSADGSQWTAIQAGDRVSHGTFYVRFSAREGDSFLQTVSVVPVANISSASLTLGGILGLNVTVSGASAQQYALRATIGEDAGHQTLSSTDGTYTVKLPAHRVHEPVKLELIRDGAVMDEQVWTLAAYGAKLREEHAGDTAMLELLKALEDHGTYAAYFAAPSGTAPGIEGVAAVTCADLEKYKLEMKIPNTGLQAVASLYLDDACDLVVKFNASAWTGNTLYIDDKAVEVTEADGKVSYTISQLLPQDWGKLYHIRVANAGGETVFEVNYSVLSYAYSSLGMTQELQEGLNGLLKAMFLYSEAATEYLA